MFKLKYKLSSRLSTSLSAVLDSLLSLIFIHFMYYEQCSIFFVYSFIVIMLSPLLICKNKSRFLKYLFIIFLGFTIADIISSYYLDFVLYLYFNISMLILSIPIIILCIVLNYLY